MKAIKIQRESQLITLGLNRIILLLIFLSMISCKDNSIQKIEPAKNVNKLKKQLKDLDNEVVKTPSYDESYIKKLEKRIANKGNVEDFQELTDYYFGESTSKLEFLPICRIMADKYNDKNASYYIYIILEKKYQTSCQLKEPYLCMSNDDKKDAIKYLKKAMKQGQEGAKLKFKTLVKKGIM
ncbi:hypothetical protein [Epilithonimonas hungarica]|uniref:Uncharacterized protein n=1 Tax=Epilithonimonas hungarica TaxID=454006 RepID=A0A1G7TNE8_9FLAO|nr:hypothetical protein [Epilithonimonas hungarica]SDG36544.1 hypothetical protein SAMN05421825_3166 [Epilithonimonas hungarica]